MDIQFIFNGWIHETKLVVQPMEQFRAPGVFNNIADDGEADRMLMTTYLLNKRIEDIITSRRITRAENIRTVHLKFDTWKEERSMIVAQIDLIDPIAQIIAEYSGSAHGDVLDFCYMHPCRATCSGRKRYGKNATDKICKQLTSELAYYGYSIVGNTNGPIIFFSKRLAKRYNPIPDHELIELVYKAILYYYVRTCEK